MKLLISLFVLVLVAKVSQGAEAGVIGNGQEKEEADFSQGFHVVEVKKEVKETFLFPISGNPSSLLSAIIGTPGFDLVRSPAIAAPLLQNFNFDSSVPTTTAPPATVVHSSVIPTAAPTTPTSTATASHYYPTTDSYSSSFNTGYTPTTARSPRPTGSYSSPTDGGRYSLKFVSSTEPTTPPATATASHYYPTTGGKNLFNTGYTSTSVPSPRPTGSYSSPTGGGRYSLKFVSSTEPTTPRATATASHYYPTTGGKNLFNTGYTSTSVSSPRPTGSYSSPTDGGRYSLKFVSTSPTTPVPVPTTSSPVPTTPYPVSSPPSSTPIPSTSNSEVDYLLDSLNFGDS